MNMLQITILALVLLLEITQGLGLASNHLDATDYDVSRRVFHLCPPQFFLVDNTCYHISDSATSWFDARRLCKRKLARLAQPNGKKKRRLVHYLRTNAPQDDSLWIGWIFDNDEYKWVAPNRTSIRKFLGPDRMALFYENRCLTFSMHTKNKTAEQNCLRPERFICQKAAERVQGIDRPRIWQAWNSTFPYEQANEAVLHPRNKLNRHRNKGDYRVPHGRNNNEKPHQKGGKKKTKWDLKFERERHKERMLKHQRNRQRPAKLISYPVQQPHQNEVYQEEKTTTTTTTTTTERPTTTTTTTSTTTARPIIEVEGDADELLRNLDRIQEHRRKKYEDYMRQRAAIEQRRQEQLEMEQRLAKLERERKEEEEAKEYERQMNEAKTNAEKYRLQQLEKQRAIDEENRRRIKMEQDRILEQLKMQAEREEAEQRRAEEEAEQRLIEKEKERIRQEEEKRLQKQRQLKEQEESLRAKSDDPIPPTPGSSLEQQDEPSTAAPATTTTSTTTTTTTTTTTPRPISTVDPNVLKSERQRKLAERLARVSPEVRREFLARKRQELERKSRLKASSNT